MRCTLVTAVVLMLASVATVQARPTSTQRCEAAKLFAAAKYAACRSRVQRQAIVPNRVPDFAGCDAAYASRWARDEKLFGAACPTLGDQGKIRAHLADDASYLTLKLAGAAVPECGDGARNGDEQCDGADLGGASCVSLGYTIGGALSCTAACQYETGACTSQRLPATGQTTAYTADKNDGIPGDVPVPDDGTLRRGAPLHYVDNGDGTITDANTGLMWEKKCDDGGPHDKDNGYFWSGDGVELTIWDWLAAVNSEGATGFADHSDWRVPNVRELLTLSDHERFIPDPAIDPAFDSGCLSGCTVTTCSCTTTGTEYWSSTTSRGYDIQAMIGDTFVGGIDWSRKSNGDELPIRAVRGGL